MSNLVCRVGWMTHYEGLNGADSITGGGSYVVKKGFGEEAYNFTIYNGRCYGRVYPGEHESINIRRLGALPTDESVDGVTVIWVAMSPYDGETKVVGWYTNATVYQEWQEAPSGSQRIDLTGNEDCGFLMETAAHHAVCLCEPKRNLSVPLGRGGLGQSNVWFCDETTGGQEFIRQFQAFRSHH